MSSIHVSQPVAGPASRSDVSSDLLPHACAGPRPRIRVMLALSSELERLAWSLIIASQQDMEIIAEVASCDEVLSLVRSRDCDVTLIDEAVLGSCRYGEFRDYCGSQSSSRFVLVTLHNVKDSLELMRQDFIHSYILKGARAEEFLQAIRSAAATVEA